MCPSIFFNMKIFWFVLVRILICAVIKQMNFQIDSARLNLD